MESALQYAAAELTADSEFVLEAMRQSGHALRNAVAELKADREPVLEAVRQTIHDWSYAEQNAAYNALSFGIAAMGCATFFFWLQRQA